jgi:aflatoxin B1 aldehyde reductase
MMTTQIIFGTASFGMDMTEFQDDDAIKSLLSTLQSLGITRLDTGARYPPLNPGQSERFIGNAKEISSTFTVDTKVYTDTRTNGGGDLGEQAMERSVSGSLDRLQRPEGVNVLYAHRADPETPLENQIQNFASQIKKCCAKSVRKMISITASAS